MYNLAIVKIGEPFRDFCNLGKRLSGIAIDLFDHGQTSRRRSTWVCCRRKVGAHPAHSMGETSDKEVSSFRKYPVKGRTFLCFKSDQTNNSRRARYGRRSEAQSPAYPVESTKDGSPA